MTPSIHKATCPEFRQQANAENGGGVQDSAFPCNCGADTLVRALAKISPRNGDVLFVDRNAIDLEQLAQMDSPSPDCDDVLFVPVAVPPGKSVSDTVALMSREMVANLLQEAKP